MDQAHLAQHAALDEFQHLLRLRMEAVHEGFHQFHAMLLRGVGHLYTFRRIERQGFLAQDVLAGLGRLDRPLTVQAVGQRDVHGVNVAIGE